MYIEQILRIKYSIRKIKKKIRKKKWLVFLKKANFYYYFTIITNFIFSFMFFGFSWNYLNSSRFFGRMGCSNKVIRLDSEYNPKLTQIIKLFLKILKFHQFSKNFPDLNTQIFMVIIIKIINAKFSCYFDTKLR